MRIHFACAERLSPDQVTQLAGQIVAGLPVAPEAVEVGPEGAGWVLYRADYALTPDELTEALMWLHRYARIAEVR